MNEVQDSNRSRSLSRGRPPCEQLAPCLNKHSTQIDDASAVERLCSMRIQLIWVGDVRKSSERLLSDPRARARLRPATMSSLSPIDRPVPTTHFFSPQPRTIISPTTPTCVPTYSHTRMSRFFNKVAPSVVLGSVFESGRNAGIEELSVYAVAANLCITVLAS